MKEQKLDKQVVDSDHSVMLHYDHSETQRHGEYRINNQGRMEYYTEGYWQEAPWLDRDK